VPVAAEAKRVASSGEVQGTPAPECCSPVL
jgi:hypothetical protein